MNVRFSLQVLAIMLPFFGLATQPIRAADVERCQCHDGRAIKLGDMFRVNQSDPTLAKRYQATYEIVLLNANEAGICVTGAGKIPMPFSLKAKGIAGHFGKRETINIFADYCPGDPCKSFGTFDSQVFRSLESLELPPEEESGALASDAAAPEDETEEDKQLLAREEELINKASEEGANLIALLRQSKLMADDTTSRKNLMPLNGGYYAGSWVYLKQKISVGSASGKRISFRAGDLGQIVTNGAAPNTLLIRVVGSRLRVLKMIVTAGKDGIRNTKFSEPITISHSLVTPVPAFTSHLE
jgi:hypothetical protein